MPEDTITPDPADDDDFIDGCDVDFEEDALPEDHQEVYPLFAGVPEHEVEQVRQQWQELADAGLLAGEG